MFPGETILSGAPSHEDNPCISEFQVMRTGAGWYIGTIYTHDGTEMEEGVTEANSRETDYFDSEVEAKVSLETYTDTGVLPRMRT